MEKQEFCTIETDILVIGRTAGGILTVTTAKSIYPDKRVVMVRKNKTVIVPCGIPYIFGTLYDTSKNRITDEIVKSAGVELIIDEVISIDKDKKVAVLNSGKKSNGTNLFLQQAHCQLFQSGYLDTTLKTFFRL